MPIKIEQESLDPSMPPILNAAFVVLKTLLQCPIPFHEVPEVEASSKIIEELIDDLMILTPEGKSILRDVSGSLGTYANEYRTRMMSCFDAQQQLGAVVQRLYLELPTLIGPKWDEVNNILSRLPQKPSRP